MLRHYVVDKNYDIRFASIAGTRFGTIDGIVICFNLGGDLIGHKVGSREGVSGSYIEVRDKLFCEVEEPNYYA
jgi:hypothetical protein